MSKVTSKLQLTLPKRLAEQYDIHPGDEVEFVAAGDLIQLLPAKRRSATRLTIAERLRLFDEGSARQREREATMKLPKSPSKDRGWRRADLYDRDGAG